MTQVPVFTLGPDVAFAAEGGGITAEPMGPDFWTKRVLEFGTGYLISRVETSADWPTWEMHPNGDEFICQITGEMDLIIEGYDMPVKLVAGDFAIVPKGHWHTANAGSTGDAIYITSGTGTQNRLR